MLFHYTDKKGHDGIRSQLDWVFKAHRQRRNDLPKGAYFTTLEPTEENLSLICRKLQIPLRKREFVFQFASVGDLKPLDLRDYILFSADDSLFRKHPAAKGDTDRAKTALVKGERDGSRRP